MAELTATAPSKLRVLKTRELKPPSDVILKIKQKKNEKLSKIPIVKFCQVFFGEGF